MRYHQYFNVIMFYLSSDIGEDREMLKMLNCLNLVMDWMGTNKEKLNPTEIEALSRHLVKHILERSDRT